jgi:hypothetical protein
MGPRPARLKHDALNRLEKAMESIIEVFNIITRFNLDEQALISCFQILDLPNVLKSPFKKLRLQRMNAMRAQQLSARWSR